MKKLKQMIEKISQFLDNLAGWGIVVTMILVVVNILLRIILKSPIDGIYEYVGYITAVVIGFGLAWCAIQKSHVAIEFIVEKLPQKVQTVISTVTGLMVLVFLLFAGYQVFCLGLKVLSSGEVSATARIPFYPFIFLVALGFIVLALVEFVNILKGVKGNVT